MYTILLEDDKSLISTKKEAIMQYSNLVDKIQFLIPLEVSDNDMTTFTSVLLEYMSPISKIYRTEFLQQSSELYNEHLQYILPVDSKITAEAGDVELQLTFYKTVMTEDGEAQVPVFKTQGYKLKIIPVANWSQFVASEFMQPLDQRIAELLVLQEEITAIQDQIMDYQSNLIDDENISEHSTYSSKKIEEKFFDQTEVNEEINSVVDETVDEKLTELDGKQTITDDEINDLFSTGDDSEDVNPDTPDDGEQGDEPEDIPQNSITDEDIENLFK